MKEEQIRIKQRSKWLTLLERKNEYVMARDAEGNRTQFYTGWSTAESVLAELREPQKFPIVAMLRQQFLDWRFYHQFRTDARSPLRQPQVGIRTPVLSHDGRDVAAALQTILEVGDAETLEQALARAFPGCALRIESPGAQFSLGLSTADFGRRFVGSELSDGTLHYLCFLANT